MCDQQKCSLCNRTWDQTPNEHGVVHGYVKKDGGVVCDYCDATDKDMWHELKVSRAKGKGRRRGAMHNIAKREKLEHRLKYINEGTVLLDGRVYYYCQARQARVKGTKKTYTMRGFQHFVDVFAK